MEVNNHRVVSIDHLKIAQDVKDTGCMQEISHLFVKIEMIFDDELLGTAGW